MTRQTSIDAYYKFVKNNGITSDRRRLVYTILYKYGPMTDSEMEDVMLQWYIKQGISISKSKKMCQYGGKRRGELVEDGLVEQTNKRKCKVTGVTCMEWDVTGNTEIQKIPSKKDKQKDFIGNLKEYQTKFEGDGNVSNDTVYLIIDTILNKIKELY